MRWLRWPLSFTAAVFSLLLSLLSVVAALVLLLALWAGTDGSLARGLQAVSLLLPAGQSLQVSGVEGSLRDGGRVGQAHWQMDALSVDAQGLELAWGWHAWLQGNWQFSRLHAKTLHIHDQRPAGSSPQAELVLPLHLDLHFAFDQLDWDGPPALQLQQLQGHYRFDGQQHVLEDASLRMADGSYHLSAQLQARRPMAVNVQASGSVLAPLRLQNRPLDLQAQAQARGTLFGADASVALAVDVQPLAATRSQLGAMQAHAQVQWQPARPQPFARATAQFAALDLARLWPQAPQTLLSGQLALQPDGADWQAHLQVQNTQPGPWDQQHLPVQSADARVRYQQGQWQLTALQAALAGGSMQAQGSANGTGAQWVVKGTLHDIQAEQLDTRWKGLAVLAGEVHAEQTPQGIAFDAQLRTPHAASAQAWQAQAKGLWSAPSLRLDTLQLQVPQAQLAGQLRWNSQSQAASGELKATLPGAQVQLGGDAAPGTGAGQLDAQVTDASAVLQWLRQWPWLAAQLPVAEAAGTLRLNALWRGGWREQGRDLQLRANISARKLALDGAGVLDDGQLALSGSPRTLALQLQAQAHAAGLPVQLQARSQLALQGSGQWHATLDQLQLRSGDAAAPWTAQLQSPLALDWQAANTSQRLSVAAGALRMGGPVAGTARVQWQAAQWTQTRKPGAATDTRWSSRGQLDDLPLAWLEWLGQTRLTNLGLRGDLLFGGQWDASQDTEGLRLRASLQRNRGDLQLLAAEPGAAALLAGTREARVELAVDNSAVRAHLLWASAAAGNAEATLSTRVQLRNGAWQWPMDAPLQGRVQASLPRVGLWSVLAPVGWRMQGTVQADAQLMGTRAQPDWKGSLEARELSVRSVVDGIDFSQGVMRLVVNGQHMDIAELSLQGAGGASGGQLLATGSVDWLPAMAGSSVAARLRMALDAQAKALRVTARADQRLVVSGTLSARLVDAHLSVRGALVADQALIVLPDDTAPRLGADVVVKRSKASTTAASATKAVPEPVTSRLSASFKPDLLITLDPGTNFQLQGHGIRTSLVGLLTLKTEGQDATPRLQGALRTVNGTYRAYGQRLNIEEGRLRFSGAYDNPALDIRAIRPNLTQTVGVQVSGTAQLPVVRLFAEPDLPDAEKLSWLLLGRASSNGGAETAMLQQAALALLSGNGRTPASQLTDAIGLDEVSLGQVATTNLDGSAGSEATVKLGKRLSRDFYVAYERSLAGALGTFYVFYDLSRRFTLRGESGTQNAVDLIFTTRFD